MGESAVRNGELDSLSCPEPAGLLNSCHVTSQQFVLPALLTYQLQPLPDAAMRSSTHSAAAVLMVS